MTRGQWTNSNSAGTESTHLNAIPPHRRPARLEGNVWCRHSSDHSLVTSRPAGSSWRAIKIQPETVYRTGLVARVQHFRWAGKCGSAAKGEGRGMQGYDKETRQSYLIASDGRDRFSVLVSWKAGRNAVKNRTKECSEQRTARLRNAPSTSSACRRASSSRGVAGKTRAGDSRVLFQSLVRR